MDDDWYEIKDINGLIDAIYASVASHHNSTNDNGSDVDVDLIKSVIDQEESEIIVKYYTTLYDDKHFMTTEILQDITMKIYKRFMGEILYQECSNGMCDYFFDNDSKKFLVTLTEKGLEEYRNLLGSDNVTPTRYI